MLKTHKNYLNRLINFACFLKSDSRMLEAISHMRAGKQPVYQMMRDIVCDARFYGVIENEVFWKRYSSAFIEGFIDSLTPEDWADERQRTIKKEDFLTSWMERHILPLTLQEQRKIEGTTVRDSVLTVVGFMMYFCVQKDIWDTTRACPRYIRTHGNAINITVSTKA